MERQDYFIDWGQRGFAGNDGTYVATASSTDTQHEGVLRNFLRWIIEHPNSRPLVEGSHLNVRTELSKSPVFTLDQLQQIDDCASENDVMIMTLPNNQTTRIRREQGLPTGRDKMHTKPHDFEDAIAWQRAIEMHPTWIKVLSQWHAPTADTLDRNRRLDAIRFDAKARLNQCDEQSWNGGLDIDRALSLWSSCDDDAVQSLGDDPRIATTVYVINFDGDGNLRGINKDDFASLMANYLMAKKGRGQNNKIRGVLYAPLMGALTQLGKHGVSRGQQQLGMRRLRSHMIAVHTGAT